MNREKERKTVAFLKAEDLYKVNQLTLERVIKDDEVGWIGSCR
jgi:hypothetical protein